MTTLEFWQNGQGLEILAYFAFIVLIVVFFRSRI